MDDWREETQFGRECAMAVVESCEDGTHTLGRLINKCLLFVGSLFSHPERKPKPNICQAPSSSALPAESIILRKPQDTSSSSISPNRQSSPQSPPNFYIMTIRSALGKRWPTPVGTFHVAIEYRIMKGKANSMVTCSSAYGSFLCCRYVVLLFS